MVVKLYKTSSQKNKLAKTITNELTLPDVKLKGECSIEQPRLVISGLSDFTYNYLYIPSYSRYYYITDIVILNNELVQIECGVDVLMSFKEQILSNKGTIERNEEIYNSMFIDSTIPATIDNNIRTVKFPEQPFESTSYIINYIG